MNEALTTQIRTLCTLRWCAIVGASAMIWLAVAVLDIPLSLPHLCGGVLVLMGVNITALWRLRHAKLSTAEAAAQLIADVAVLTWMMVWSGGLANPFSSLFLIPIALAAASLPLRWMWSVTATSMIGYCIAALLAPNDPHAAHAAAQVFQLHLVGMALNFVVSALVFVYFLSQLLSQRRQRDLQIATLRDRFTRNEGILALATHAASVAHELNTPLATMTLLNEEMAADAIHDSMRADANTMQKLIEQCRDRVRALALPAESGGDRWIKLDHVVAQWRLIRPRTQLLRTGSFPDVAVDAAVGHLLLALLNNAADASEERNDPRVALDVVFDDTQLEVSIRDHGKGFDAEQELLPSTMFRSAKPGGLGIGLALSHATIERLGGSLTLQAAIPDGTEVGFILPMRAILAVRPEIIDA